MLLNPELLRYLLVVLPLHAEEGGLCETVSEEDMISAMSQSSVGHETAQITLSVLRRIFEMLCLLDTDELQADNWAFVSFPASLLARSLVESLATPGLTLFPENYWKQGPHRPENIIEEQRVLLSELESRRERFNPADNISPIRVVHVAWGMIKLGTEFLLVHRDDKSRAERNYVMPGGRLNMDDFPSELRTTKLLRELADVNSKQAQKALKTTLNRELEEELGLIHGCDFSVTELTRLEPYIKLEGARNNHALSAYNFMLFSIQLTMPGNLKLLDKIANEPEYIVRFSINNLVEGRRHDGKTAFLDIFHENFKKELPKFLDAIQNSSAFKYQYTSQNEAIDIPLSLPDAFLRGKTGKEKPVLFGFNKFQLDLILLLAWHTKGFSIVGLDKSIQLLGDGWVKVLPGRTHDLILEMIALTTHANTPLLDFVAGAYLRISFSKELIYFIGSHFSYGLDSKSENKATLRVVLPEIDTNLATLKSETVDIPVNRNSMRIIDALNRNVDPEMDSTILTEDLDRDLRQKFDKFIKPIGLRKFIRKVDGDWSIIPELLL